MFKSVWGHWSKCWNIFLLRLDSVRLTYRTFLTSGSACIGILRRELHRCVRIEKPPNLGFYFAQFGVRKCPKTHSNRTPLFCSNLASGWNSDGILEPFSGTNRSGGAPKPPERIYFPGSDLDTCFNLVRWLLCCLFYTGFGLFCPNPNSFFLSHLSLLLLHFHNQNPWFSSIFSPQSHKLDHLKQDCRRQS